MKYKKHKLYKPFREIFLIKDKNNNFGLEINLQSKYCYFSSHLHCDKVDIYGKFIDGKWRLGVDNSEGKSRILKEYGVDSFNMLKAIFGNWVQEEIQKK